MLGEIAAAGATAALNIANFVLDKCGLTYPKENLQGFGNFGDGAMPLYLSFLNHVSNGSFANAEIANTQSRRLPKKDADKINKESSKTDSRTNKCAKVAIWSVSEAAVSRAA